MLLWHWGMRYLPAAAVLRNLISETEVDCKGTERVDGGSSLESEQHAPPQELAKGKAARRAAF